MPPRFALALAALLAGSPALAQRVPAPPADAPPPPAQLPEATPTGPAQPPLPPLALPAGIDALPAGGWRVRFAAEGRSVEDPPVLATLAEIGRRMAAGPRGRVGLVAEASGPANDVSAARRVSLARALAVKRALAAGGLAENRIDVRPLGRTAAGQDAVDILPAPANAPRPQR